MEVGTEQIVVNVAAGAGELLQTSEPVKGGNFSQTQVASLPQPISIRMTLAACCRVW